MDGKIKHGCCFERLNMKLLLIEKHYKTVSVLLPLLKKSGYAIDIAMDEEALSEMAFTGVYDLIIIDYFSPSHNSIVLLKKLRSLKLDTLILFITTKATSQYRVEALDAGADDYLVKPFFNDELLARLRALTRRKNKQIVSELISVAGLTLNPLKCKVLKGSEPIYLTLKETLLLEMLMHNFGQVLTKERIMEKVWSYNSEINLANVDLYIHYLRKKLSISNIKTIRGVGYLFHEDNRFYNT